MRRPSRLQPEVAKAATPIQTCQHGDPAALQFAVSVAVHGASAALPSNPLSSLSCRTRLVGCSGPLPRSLASPTTGMLSTYTFDRFTVVLLCASEWYTSWLWR